MRDDFSFIVSRWVFWKMDLLAFTINKNEKQSGNILSNIWKWELRNVVAASKWETRFGSWRIDSVNFVCKCNFSKFYCFWVLGFLLRKVWLQNLLNTNFQVLPLAHGDRPYAPRMKRRGHFSLLYRCGSLSKEQQWVIAFPISLSRGCKRGLSRLKARVSFLTIQWPLRMKDQWR